MMNILAIDTSAVCASVCIANENKIIGQTQINAGLTHSQTLLVMLEDLLKITGLSLEQIDAFAVNNGPGSFTGIRIAISAVKGIADATDKKVIGISTLESMAYTSGICNGIICAAMDARCNQVYTSLFQSKEFKITRLTPDKAIKIDDLAELLKAYDEPIFLTGDGAELCYNSLHNDFENLKLLPVNLRFQSAAGTAMAALQRDKKDYNFAGNILPVYLRLPQAQREREERIEKK